MVGRLHFKGTKIGNYRVDYNSTRSAAPKLGRGGARCRGRWIWYGKQYLIKNVFDIEKKTIQLLVFYTFF